MRKTKEAIDYIASELIPRVTKRFEKNLPSEEAYRHFERIARTLTIQGEHLQNTSGAAVEQGLKLKADLEAAIRPLEENK